MHRVTGVLFVVCLGIADTERDARDDKDSKPVVKTSSNCECSFGTSNCDCFCKNSADTSTFGLPALPCNVTHCPNFSFELEGGFYDYVKPEFFRVLQITDGFFFDVVDVDFTDFLPNYPIPSPFMNVSFRSEAYVVLLKCKIRRNWNWPALSELRPASKLARSSIQIMQTEIPVLTSDFSAVYGGTLTNLRISRCSLKVLEKGAFSGLYDISEISLARNEIGKLQRDMFPMPAKSLVKLILSHNELSSLPDNLFDNMPSLQLVDLTGNPISTLGERVFASHVQKVRFVGLEGFLLNCDCGLKWINNVTRTSLVDKNLEGVTCYSPDALKGEKAYHLTVEQLCRFPE